MFGMSMTEILVIAVLALLVLGPEKLPKVAQMIGKGLREIRRATSDIRQAIEIDDIRSQFKEELDAKTWGRAGQLDDPYSNTTPPEDDEEYEDGPQIGPYGVPDEDDDDYDDAVLVEEEDDASSDADEPDAVTAVPLDPWHSLTGIGVFIRRQAIPTVPTLTLDEVAAVPVTGGLTLGSSDEEPDEGDEEEGSNDEEHSDDDEALTSRALSERVTAVGLPHWKEETGVGVLIVRQPMTAALLSLLGGVASVPIEGGVVDIERTERA